MKRDPPETLSHLYFHGHYLSFTAYSVLFYMLELRTTYMFFVYNTVFFSWRVLLTIFWNLSTYWMCYLWQHVYISSSTGIVYHCPKCDKRILSHAARIRCPVCDTTYHLKCISIDPAELFTSEITPILGTANNGCLIFSHIIILWKIMRWDVL